MNEQLDGTGGGLGRYRGYSLKELEDQFQKCREESGWRGASAVLRIAHEQLDARGGLGMYPWLTLTCVIAAIAIYLVPLSAGPLKDQQGHAALVALILASMFGWTTFITRTERRGALYQEAQIREMSLSALLDIARAPNFKPKSLDYTQRLTLERMLKKAKRSDPEFVSLLNGERGL